MPIGSGAGRDSSDGLINNWKLRFVDPRSISQWPMRRLRAACPSDTGPHGRKRFPLFRRDSAMIFSLRIVSRGPLSLQLSILEIIFVRKYATATLYCKRLPHG